MSGGEGEPAKLDARDHRRWLIGITISLVFGIFSMVMALLSYFPRARSAAPAAVAPTAVRGDVGAPEKRGNVRRDHRR